MIQTRQYGGSGPTVVVLHGGPGAPGTVAPLARELEGSFRVIEPLQRGSGDTPLTVARHVGDLKEVLDSRSAEIAPPLVGHSWGAMLALAFAAEHPRSLASLTLIGCGTFDPASRDRMRETRRKRMTDEARRQVERLSREIRDPDRRMRALGDLFLELDSWDLLRTDSGSDECDARAHRETWDDMMRLQEEGLYPAAFEAIEVPVLLLHGRVDPHPGKRIRDTLAAHIPHLEYRELDRCGHTPWLEREARTEFLAILRDRLSR